MAKKARARPRAEPDDNRAEILGRLGEVFRVHGYEGASLSLITDATGLGKGSLYHLFPGGKQQMAADVLAEIDAWFRHNVFTPLIACTDPRQGIEQMFVSVERYFLSGRRVCLVGVFALGAARDTFGKAVRGYFKAWAEALTATLLRLGRSPADAVERAEDILLGIQGALVLARASGDPAIFARALQRLRKRV